MFRSIGLTLALSALLTATILPAGGCASRAPSSLTTPQAKAAWSADQVVKRVGEFQQVVIDLADAKKLPMPIARQLVQFCLDTLGALKQFPQGWQAVAKASWSSVRGYAQAATDLSPWVPILDSLIGS